MQYTSLASDQGCSMLLCLQTLPASLNADKFDVSVAEEGMEEADTIAASTNAGNQVIRKTAICR